MKLVKFCQKLLADGICKTILPRTQEIESMPQLEMLDMRIPGPIAVVCIGQLRKHGVVDRSFMVILLCASLKSTLSKRT